MVLQGSQILNTSRNSWPTNWSNRTSIVGVINVTPDSFSDGGLFNDFASAFEHACSCIDQGAQILDLGAQSTRPGAVEVGAEIEIKRLIPVIKELKLLLQDGSMLVVGILISLV